ncbi:RNA helicase [Pseudomonas phage PMBT14]|uniref:RNA helicase n=1 Tax=Pseudomonas phage PMBT14 TaxID=2059855 RepID=A0A2I6PI64_9CAUD|nr:RNA helicase [Pseudomonas phage PMBT14]AUM59755.1 RNA helicase [Pseudomonas phage PMBT14]
MTTFTAEQKAAIKEQAKALGINVVGKSIEKLQTLILEKQPEAPEDSSLEHVRKLATELKIKYTKSTTREELVFAIADVKGWANEKAEVIEFLIAGGNIEELPGFTAIAPKPNSRETSAGGKVEPQEPKKPRKPTKATDAAKPASKPAKAASAKPKATGETVSIQDICEELDVEGRVARRKLRGSDIVKPSESGWNWEAGHADIAKVKELLKK